MSKRKHIEQWLSFVGAYGCLVCARPNNIHHIKDRAMPRNDLFVLPLCREHHQDGPDAYHTNPTAWEALHGSQWRLYARVLEDYLRSLKK